MIKIILNLLSQSILILFFVFFFLLFPKNAFAYLDLYTGSYFFQIIMGGLLGFLFAIKIYWKKIKAFFIQKLPKKKERNQDEEQH